MANEGIVITFTSINWIITIAITSFYTPCARAIGFNSPTCR